MFILYPTQIQKGLGVSMSRVLSHFYSLAKTVQTDCSEVTESDANIIFIEKRRSFSASLAMHMHC